MKSKHEKLFLVLAIAGMATAAAWAQANTDPDQYRIEYGAYQKALEATDPDAKADELLGFINQFPKSTLVQYALPEYREILKSAYDSGNAARTKALADKLLNVFSDDLAAVYFTADILFRKQQYRDVVPYAQKLHGLKDADAKAKNYAAYILALAGVQAGDRNLVSRYGDQAADNYEPKDTYAILAELMRIEFANGNKSKSAAYAARTIDGLEAARGNSDSAEWKKYVDDNIATGYAIQGDAAFDRQQWSTAIRHFSKVLNVTRKKELIGEAYYKIGMSLWRQGKIEPEAMRAFARGYRLGTGEHAKACFRHLEELYKSLHNGATAGMDEFIENSLRGA